MLVTVITTGGDVRPAAAARRQRARRRCCMFAGCVRRLHLVGPAHPRAAPLAALGAARRRRGAGGLRVRRGWRTPTTRPAPVTSYGYEPDLRDRTRTTRCRTSSSTTAKGSWWRTPGSSTRTATRSGSGYPDCVRRRLARVAIRCRPYPYCPEQAPFGPRAAGPRPSPTPPTSGPDPAPRRPERAARRPTGAPTATGPPGRPRPRPARAVPTERPRPPPTRDPHASGCPDRTMRSQLGDTGTDEASGTAPTQSMIVTVSSAHPPLGRNPRARAGRTAPRPAAEDAPHRRPAVADAGRAPAQPMATAGKPAAPPSTGSRRAAARRQPRRQPRTAQAASRAGRPASARRLPTPLRPPATGAAGGRAGEEAVRCEEGARHRRRDRSPFVVVAGAEVRRRLAPIGNFFNKDETADAKAGRLHRRAARGDRHRGARQVERRQGGRVHLHRGGVQRGRSGGRTRPRPRPRTGKACEPVLQGGPGGLHLLQHRAGQHGLRALPDEEGLNRTRPVRTRPGPAPTADGGAGGHRAAVGVPAVTGRRTGGECHCSGVFRTAARRGRLPARRTTRRPANDD